MGVVDLAKGAAVLGSLARSTTSSPVLYLDKALDETGRKKTATEISGSLQRETPAGTTPCLTVRLNRESAEAHLKVRQFSTMPKPNRFEGLYNGAMHCRITRSPAKAL